MFKETKEAIENLNNLVEEIRQDLSDGRISKKEIFNKIGDFYKIKKDVQDIDLIKAELNQATERDIKTLGLSLISEGIDLDLPFKSLLGSFICGYLAIKQAKKSFGNLFNSKSNE